MDNVKLLPNAISECALYLGRPDNVPCIGAPMIERIGKTVGVDGSASEIISGAKAALGCTTERCVLKKLSGELGADSVEKEINLVLKVQGPTDTKLLSNIHIDATLGQWQFARKDFFAYNFNMLNYASYSYKNGHIYNQPDSLATILFSDVYNGVLGPARKCIACVINSDEYQGAGKHWMALFGDARGPCWTVEFFNSSGRAPAPEWINWLVKTKNNMEKIIADNKLSNTVEIIRTSSMRHQKSKSECGLYSLFYIWARLHNVPHAFFTKNIIDDKLMFEFRQHLFDDPSRKCLSKFNWSEYKNTVNIEWEKD
jgi:hypothetical protein